MYFNDFRILNYKSYRDSGVIALAPAFNVFVGRNNGGKTALLEALSLTTFSDKPHRHSGIPRGQPVNPLSIVEYTVTLSPLDLRRAIFNGGSVWFPITEADSRGDKGVRSFSEFMERDRTFRIRHTANEGMVSLVYPSHGMFQAEQANFSTQFRVNAERSDIAPHQTAGTGNDNVFSVVATFVVSSIYSFRAERFSLASHPYGDNSVLAPGAQNLPEVLNVLQGEGFLFARFNNFLRQIFPTIREVSVRPWQGQFAIMVWNSEAPPDRSDLAVELSESGTGIGQVLAMLYILVTSGSPRTIIIDEPNTFLHPGAVRKLLEVMRSNPVQHQFVVTTHSPDFIRISEAETVYLIGWGEEQSSIKAISPGNVSSLTNALLEIGARLSDFFGADNVLWVEGPTEEECFPKIIQKIVGRSMKGLSVIAVRATGDFDSRRASAVAIWDIYKRLSSAGPLMPATLAICLDREGRSETDIERAIILSGRLIKFLPRRCYENYLIHPRAISSVLNGLPTFMEDPISPEKVGDWLKANGCDREYDTGDSWGGDLGDLDWLKRIRGARLLHNLFSALSGAREEYRKVEHGSMLTDWICAHDHMHFGELEGFLAGLISE